MIQNRSMRKLLRRTFRWCSAILFLACSAEEPSPQNESSNPVPLGGACASISDCESGLTCSVGSTIAGLCTRACSTTTECEVLGGNAFKCTDGFCVAKCSTDADCRAGACNEAGGYCVTEGACTASGAVCSGSKSCCDFTIECSESGGAATCCKTTVGTTTSCIRHADCCLPARCSSDAGGTCCLPEGAACTTSGCCFPATCVAGRCTP